MSYVSLPFLTTVSDRNGQPHAAWATSDFKIEEASPDEFSVACVSMLSSEYAYVTYAARGGFYSNAYRPIEDVFRVTPGIQNEKKYVPSEVRDLWISNLSETALVPRVGRRLSEAGKHLHQGRWLNGGRAIPADRADASDRSAFQRWCTENLLDVDGTIVHRIHSPSLVLAWNAQQYRLGRACETHITFLPPVAFGSHNFNAGLHFSLLSNGLQRDIDDLPNTIRPPVRLSSDDYRERVLDDLINLGKFGSATEKHKGTHFCFDSNAFIGRDEDLGERSVISVARAISLTSSPHLHAPGPLRDSLFELRRLFSLPPEERSTVFSEQVAEVLSAMPCKDEEEARRWFIEKALDLWDHRDIALSPEVMRPMPQ